MAAALTRPERRAIDQARLAWRMRALQVLQAHVKLAPHPWGPASAVQHYVHVPDAAWHPGYPAQRWPGATQVVLSWPPGKPYHATAWARHWNQMHGFPSLGGVPWAWEHRSDLDVLVGQPFDLSGGPSGKLWLPEVDYASFPHRVVQGLAEDGTVLTWDMLEHPHMLAGGATGSGKTKLLHNTLYHLLAADVLQAVVVLDWKRKNYRALRGLAWDAERCAGVHVALPTLDAQGLPTTLDRMEAAADAVLAELGRRMLASEDLDEDEHPWRRRLVVMVVDEALATLQREDVARDDKSALAVAARRRNAQRARIDYAIQQVALLGRELNVHLALGASSPRKEFLRGEAVAAVQHRVYLGQWQDVAEPVVMFGSGQVQSPPPWKGYGIWRVLRPDADPLDPYLYFKAFWVETVQLAALAASRLWPAQGFTPAKPEVPADEARSPWLRAA